MTSNENRTHDWTSGDPLYFTAIRAVSAVTGKETTAIDPLHSVVDPEAIDALIDPSREGAVHLSFSYEGCTVSIESSGEVVVQSEE